MAGDNKTSSIKTGRAGLTPVNRYRLFLQTGKVPGY
jgi:hypothetical protein